MKLFLRPIVGLAIAGLLVACQGTQSSETSEAAASVPGATAGMPDAPDAILAPDFTLPDAHGKSHTLSKYRGKTIVLEWHNHDCPFVVKHYSSDNMQSLQREYTGKGVVWLTINSSAPGKQGHVTAEEAVRLTADRKAAPTALLLDPAGEVGRLYRAKVTPHMFVIDPHGRIVYDGAIDDKRSSNPGDIPSSRNHVRAALDEVRANRQVSVPRSDPYGYTVKYAN